MPTPTGRRRIPAVLPRPAGLVAAAAAAVLLAGCAVTHRPATTRAALLAGAPAQGVRSQAVVDSVIATVRAMMDTAMRARLAPAFAEGRTLAVATTDLDLGTWRLWDLGQELGAGAAGLTRAQDALLASTAIPGIFPPLVLDGHVHVDGGTIGNVLPVLALDDYRMLAEALRAWRGQRHDPHLGRAQPLDAHAAGGRAAVEAPRHRQPRQPDHLPRAAARDGAGAARPGARWAPRCRG